MIEYRKGDLFEDNPKIIAHGCNAKGFMGSGFAKQIRKKFPEAYNDYAEYCRLREPTYLLGTNRVYTKGDVTIVNCITQQEYGIDGKRYVSYDAVNDCMSKLASAMVWKGVMGDWRPITEIPVCMPKIGAGLGGGEWSIIEAIINHHLKEQHIIVYEL